MCVQHTLTTILIHDFMCVCMIPSQNAADGSGMGGMLSAAEQRKKDKKDKNAAPPDPIAVEVLKAQAAAKCAEQFKVRAQCASGVMCNVYGLQRLRVTWAKKSLYRMHGKYIVAGFAVCDSVHLC